MGTEELDKVKFQRAILDAFGPIHVKMCGGSDFASDMPKAFFQKDVHYSFATTTGELSDNPVFSFGHSVEDAISGLFNNISRFLEDGLLEERTAGGERIFFERDSEEYIKKVDRDCFKLSRRNFF